MRQVVHQRAAVSCFVKPGRRLSFLITKHDSDVPFGRRNLGAAKGAKASSRGVRGTILESARLVSGAMKVTIAMRIEYLAAIVIAVLAAGTGLAVNSVGSLPSAKQSTPTAVQAADRLAETVDPFFLRSGG